MNSDFSVNPNYESYWQKPDSSHSGELNNNIQLSEIQKIELNQKITNESSQEFIKNFHEDIGYQLSLYHDPLELKDEYHLAAKNFLEGLTQGEGEIEGNPDVCRFTAVSIQAAMEATLVAYLETGRINNIEATFLTPTPCTPLRVLKDENWKPDGSKLQEWTVEIRKRIIAELVQKNVAINVCYEVGSPLSEIYNANKEKYKNILDCPLKGKIPQDLVGAFYQYQDNQGRIYYIATQGFQIQQHGENKIEKWKIWAGPESSEAVSFRKSEVWNYIIDHSVLYSEKKESIDSQLVVIYP